MTDTELQELQELRAFKEKVEKKKEFNAFKNNLQPIFKSNGGKEKYIDRFISVYEKELKESDNLELAIKSIKEKEDLFFTSPAIETTQSFKNKVVEIEKESNKKEKEDLFIPGTGMRR